MGDYHDHYLKKDILLLIDFNTEKRKSATNDFVKDLFN